MNTSNKLSILFIIIVLVCAGVYLSRKPVVTAPTPVVTNQTPVTTPEPLVDTTTWKVFSDTKVSFKYPETLPSSYVHSVDWPPQVQITDGPFTCAEAGSVEARAGQTEPRTINGRQYCVTREGEGAAGSMYINYAFATPFQNKVAIFTFTTRQVQCGNYDEPQMSACKTDTEHFDIYPIADAMVNTLTIK